MKEKIEEAPSSGGKKKDGVRKRPWCRGKWRKERKYGKY